MYKISDFATLSRVSAKMLRHYAALGLFSPAYTDPVTGYRYYAAEQLPRLNRLVALKDLGFTLEQIADLLDADLPLEQLRDALLQRRAEVAQRIAEEQQRLAALDRRLAQLAAAPPPPYEVLLRPLPAVPVAAARTVVADEGQLFELLATVEDYVAAQQARAARPATVVYHGCVAGAMDVEVAVPLAAPIAGAPWAQPSILPALPLVACVVHVGDDAGLLEACTALHSWIDAHGYQLAGPYRERYLRLSGADQRALPQAFVAACPEAAMTELQVPVLPVQAA